MSAVFHCQSNQCNLHVNHIFLLFLTKWTHVRWHINDQYYLCVLNLLQFKPIKMYRVMPDSFSFWMINAFSFSGIIVFASDQEVACIMGAVKRRNMTQRFSWIGSDGWSARNLVSDGNEEVVEGTISVQPQAKPVKGFEEYFFNRVPNPNGDSYFEGK